RFWPSARRFPLRVGVRRACLVGTIVGNGAQFCCLTLIERGPVKFFTHLALFSCGLKVNATVSEPVPPTAAKLSAPQHEDVGFAGCQNGLRNASESPPSRRTTSTHSPRDEMTAFRQTCRFRTPSEPANLDPNETLALISKRQ